MNQSAQRVQTSDKVNLDPVFQSDHFQNITGTSLSKDTSVMKFSRGYGQFFHRHDPNCRKMLYLATLKNASKKF